MKYTIQWLLVLLTIFNPILANAALTDFDRQELAFENLLAPYNSGFESGKVKWTASGGTLAAVTSGTNLLAGKGSATWDASTSGQTLTSQAVTIPKGYYGLDCEVEILAQVPSGTATHYVRAYDGTNVQAYQSIVSSTTPRWNPVTFPCPQSGTIALQIYANADEPLIAIDVGYIGRSKRVGSTQLISEWTSYTPTLTNGTNVSVTKVSWRQVGDSIQIMGYLSVTGAGSGADFAVSLPTGIVMDTGKFNGSANNHVLGSGEWLDNGTGRFVLMPVYASTTVFSFQKQQVGALQGSDLASSDAISFSIMAPVVGWTAQTTASIDAISKRGSIYFASGSATNTGSVAAFNVAGFGTNTLEGQALAPTTANDLGIRMTGAPAATYEVQATGRFYASSPATTGTRTVCNYSLYDGTSTRGDSYAIATGAGSNETNDGIGSLTGQFVLSSAGTINVVVRGQRVTGNGTCYAEGPVSISIKNVSQNSPAIVLAGSRNALRTGRTSTQSIADSTFVVVLFNSNTTSDDGWYDSGTGRYTFLKNGCYFVAPVVAFSGSSAGSTRALEIRKNGTRTAFIAPRAGSLSGSATSVVGQDLVCGSSGDYIDVTAYQDTGGALNTVAGIDSTYLTIFRVAGGPN